MLFKTTFEGSFFLCMSFEDYMINCEIIQEIHGYQYHLGGHSCDPCPFRVIVTKTGDSPTISNAVLGFTAESRKELEQFIKGTNSIIQQKFLNTCLQLS